MKKIMIIALLTIATTAGSYAADLLFWGNGTGLLLDSTGSEVIEASGWLIRMYESTDASIDFSVGVPTDDDVYTGVETHLGDLLLGVDGYFYQELTDGTFGTAAVGDSVYCVIFDGSTIGAANYYAVIDNSLFTMPNYSSTPQSYDPGGTIAGDWQAVPEPATAMLLAMGVGLAWLGRSVQKYSAS